MKRSTLITSGAPKVEKKPITKILPCIKSLFSLIDFFVSSLTNYYSYHSLVSKSNAGTMKLRVKRKMKLVIAIARRSKISSVIQNWKSSISFGRKNF